MNMSSLNVNHPPVTVYVVTYNSSKTVVETLESIKGQTYQEIGLLVSDDCSTDDTVKVCADWMAQNNARFLFTQILTTPFNTGVSANVNRAADACTTEFCKGIAGDDKLLPHCIERNVAYMLAHPQSVVVFSKVELFGRKRDVKNFVFPFDYGIFALSAAEQNRWLREKENCIPAPASFTRQTLMRKNGIRADERIPMMEDWPLWINITEKGIHLDFFDETTVAYRVGSGSLTTARRTPRKTMVTMRLFRLHYFFEKEYLVNPNEAIAKLAEEEVNMMEGSIYFRIKETLRPIRKAIEARYFRK